MEWWRNGGKGFESQDNPTNTIFNGASVENISYDVLQYSNHPILPGPDL